MTRTTLLLSSALGLSMALAGSAAIAASNHRLPANVRPSLRPVTARQHQRPFVNELGSSGVLYEAWNTSTVKTILPIGNVTTFAYPIDHITGMKCVNSKSDICLVESEHEVEVFNTAGTTAPTQFAIIPVIAGTLCSGAGFYSGASDVANQYLNKELRCSYTGPVNTATTYVVAVSTTQFTAHHQSDYTVFQN